MRNASRASTKNGAERVGVQASRLLWPGIGKDNLAASKQCSLGDWNKERALYLVSYHGRVIEG